jgi:sec-independent protein translocase protein TatA
MTGLISPGHLMILLLVLLLVFGAKRLPEVGRSLGHGMREFRDSIGGDGGGEPPAAAEHALDTASPDSDTATHTPA